MTLVHADAAASTTTNPDIADARVSYRRLPVRVEANFVHQRPPDGGSARFSGQRDDQSI